MSQRTTATGTVLKIVEETLPDNVIRRKNGMLYGRIEIDGHEVRKSLGTRDPVEADQRARRWLAEVSPKHEHDELTFAQVASAWIETYRSNYTDKTWERYRQSLKMLKPYFGELVWADVTKTKINEYMADRRKAGTTQATVNRDLAVLSNIIEHAVDQEWCEENPLRSMSRKKRKEKRDPFVLPPDEMLEWVWRHIRGAGADLCRFALETGMRLDEMVFLDKRKNMLFDRSAAQLFVTKTHRVRVLTLSKLALDIARRQPGDGLVFRSRSGEPIKSIGGMWRQACDRAALSWSDHHPDQPFIRVRFHDLRHIFAIRYLRNGGNIYVLQKHLGHATLRQTEAYLQYLTPEEQARAQGV